MRTIYIDGKQHNVYRELKQNAGWTELTVGVSRPTAAHKVPTNWWNAQPMPANRIHTGGHWYAMRKPMRHCMGNLDG